jgi:hypothetical protein
MTTIYIAYWQLRVVLIPHWCAVLLFRNVMLAFSMSSHIYYFVYHVLRRIGVRVIQPCFEPQPLSLPEHIIPVGLIGTIDQAEHRLYTESFTIVIRAGICVRIVLYEVSRDSLYSQMLRARRVGNVHERGLRECRHDLRMEL